MSLKKLRRELAERRAPNPWAELQPKLIAFHLGKWRRKTKESLAYHYGGGRGI